MYTIEFQAKIIDGNIKIPEEYRGKLGYHVKVILLTEETVDNSVDMIGELLKSPLKQPNF